MHVKVPRIVISGLRGGMGKTLVSLAVIRGWHKKGWTIAPFKKGPDFIDASWLRQAAERPCYNLDTFLIDEATVIASFAQRSQAADIAVIEGNRGLYDGMDVDGSHSTATVAKLLNAPVILTVDCTKATRTIAALILGCQHMDPQLKIHGVVLNHIAGSRHGRIIRSAIEQYCQIPVLGELPRFSDFPLQERHMGLTPPQEHQRLSDAFSIADEVAEKFLDLPKLEDIARDAPDFDVAVDASESTSVGISPSVRIGVIRDSAFQFYYPENLEELERQGGIIIEISALNDRELPPVDALYIGGGFPETHAERLADNISFRRSLADAVESGLPVYAECGGSIYLGKQVTADSKTYPMTGVFPVSFVMQRKPQGHGYTVLRTERVNPFFETGTIVRGHEFHYSGILERETYRITMAFDVERGYGFDGKHDGLCHKNVLSTYTHLHALGERRWAKAVIRQAVAYKMTSSFRH